MGKYKYAISLGFCCWVAMDLRRYGLRSFSSPFDFIKSFSFENVIGLINNKFQSFIDPQYLLICEEDSRKFINTKVKLRFVHELRKGDILEKKLPELTEKYERRIERFFSAISEPTLFFRYLYDQDDYDWTEKNIEFVMSTLKSFNQDNNIIFIGEEEIIENQLMIYKVKKDRPHIATDPIDKNRDLREIISKGIINEADRSLNLEFNEQTEIVKRMGISEGLRSLRNKKVVIFGAGARGRYIYNQLIRCKIMPEYFVDNNSAKWNQSDQETGLPIYSPEILFTEDRLHTKILVSPQEPLKAEIKSQLVEMGLE